MELGRGRQNFTPFPPAEAFVEIGPQGSLMFNVAVRGKGFGAGDVANPLERANPYLGIVLSLNNYAGQGGRIIADGFWHRGFSAANDALELAGLQPTVPIAAAKMRDVEGKLIYAELFIVDSSGLTLCQETTFTAVR